MNKTLVNLTAGILLPTLALVSGCMNTYQKPVDDFKHGKWTIKQQQFLDSIHKKFGEEVVYKEIATYARERLGENKEKYFMHYLADYIRKTQRIQFNDKELVAINEIVRKLD